VDVWGEATALRRVLDNLLGNAIAVTPSGGLVQLRVEMGTGITTFVVSDSGVGLSDEQKTRIFDPLVSYRGGTGLGLAIVRDLVTTLGGNISVSSEIGVGSSFTVDLLATTQG
jgi:signal transduction histidine kinase